MTRSGLARLGWRWESEAWSEVCAGFSLSISNINMARPLIDSGPAELANVKTARVDGKIIQLCTRWTGTRFISLISLPTPLGIFSVCKLYLFFNKVAAGRQPGGWWELRTSCEDVSLRHSVTVASRTDGESFFREISFSTKNYLSPLLCVGKYRKNTTRIARWWWWWYAWHRSITQEIRKRTQYHPRIRHYDVTQLHHSHIR